MKMTKAEMGLSHPKESFKEMTISMRFGYFFYIISMRFVRDY